MKVKYVGPFDEVEIAATGLFCKQGEVVEVPDGLAGRAPHSYLEEAEDGAEVEVHDPGDGLLAQVDNWQPAGGESGGGGEKSVDDMTVDELRAYAEAHSVDLGDATKKADILAVVKEA